ncbi:MAG: RsmD family RNA methyltransferase [Bacteroidaceae bacterium]|nr:RsmD family RNA methyltransferase [Bacteroidaceae bacterium]
MRIITGKYKGRHFEIPRSFKARPTTDFAKENLFNVLRGYLDFEDAHALDLFSGTGSITLELLSRGCSRVVSVEKDPFHYRVIEEFLYRLGDENAFLIRGDVFKFLSTVHEQFNLIFADPPYTLPNISDLPDLILERDLLLPSGLFILEHGKRDDFKNHPRFVEHRAYGSVNFSFFQ